MNTITSNNKRFVLITGCSSGIGACLAKKLSDYGYHVLATVRKKKDIVTLKEQNIDTFQLDLQSDESIINAVEWAITLSNGNLYALINNAAYGQPGAVEDLSREALIEQFQTNVFGTQVLTNLIIPVMRKNNSGRIIQISSILGLICLPYRGAYNASKYAFEALSDTLRLELIDTDIHVSLIEPGPITSDFRKNANQMFEKHIDLEKTHHNEDYQRILKRVDGTKKVPFTLPSEAVLKKVVHALDSKKPKIRYKITIPAIVFSILKRFFPDRLFDAFINYFSRH